MMQFWISLGQLLVFFLRLQEFARIAHRDSAREAACVLNPIQLLFNRLPQHRIVDDAKDKQRFWDLPKGLQRLIQRVLLRVGIEPAKQIRGRHFLQLDGRDGRRARPGRSAP